MNLCLWINLSLYFYLDLKSNRSFPPKNNKCDIILHIVLQCNGEHTKLKEEDFFRLSFISNLINTPTLRTNIKTLIYSVFLEKNNYPQSVFELITIISEKYDLDFASTELENVIKNDKNIEIGSDEDAEVKYRLVYKKFEKLSLEEKQFSLRHIIDIYLNSFKNNYNHGRVENLITNYIYTVFNRNKTAILQLMNYSSEKVSDLTKSYTDEEKTIINDFINWQNEDKDKVIFNTISYCIDYCMLTTKKDINAFIDILRGKQFFLDSNVILRLIGFNNIDRQKVLLKFLKRCDDSGISIKYTNFTISEVENTIRNTVSNLASINNGNTPFKRKYSDFFLSNKKDILYLYNEWANNNLTSYKDYKSFSNYLIKKINNIIKKYEKVTFENQKLVDINIFTRLFNSLKNYKENLHIETYDNSIEIDINNFICINDIRKKEYGTDIFSYKTYIISTDSKFCDWNKELYPGNIPICVLPSIWYSIILKLNGRTTDDYKAFTSFLNMRYKINSDSNFKKKEDIIRFVQRLDEPKFIKEKIIDSIYEKLQDTNTDYTPQQIVEETEVEVEQREIKRISDAIGINFVEEGKLKVINQIVETKLSHKHKLIDWCINILPKIKQVLNFFCGCFIVIFLILCIKTPTSITFPNQTASLYDKLSFIRNIFGILTMFISIIDYLIILPIITICTKYDKSKATNKLQEKLIKKYIKK